MHYNVQEKRERERERAFFKRFNLLFVHRFGEVSSKKERGEDFLEATILKLKKRNKYRQFIVLI
jgi:hypothetical protein